MIPSSSYDYLEVSNSDITLEYFDSKMTEIEERACHSWLAILKKTQDEKLDADFEYTCMKLLPFFKYIPNNIFETIQYNQYYIDAISYIQKSPANNDCGSLIKLAISHLAIGSFFKASCYIRSMKITGYQPKETSEIFITAICEFYLNNYQEAKELFGSCLNHDEKLIVFYSHFFLGVINKSEMRIEEALRHFSRIKDEKTSLLSSLDVMAHIGDCFYLNKEYSMATAIFTKIALTGSKEATKAFIYAQMPNSTFHESDMMELCSGEEFAADRDFTIMRAYLLIKDSQIGPALRLLHEYLSIFSLDSQAWYLFGFSNFLFGKYKKSTSAFQNASIISPNTPKYRLDMGISLEFESRIEEAKLLYHQCVTCFPNNLEFSNRLRFLSSFKPEEVYLASSDIKLCDISFLLKSPLQNQVNTLISTPLELPFKLVSFFTNNLPVSINSTVSLFSNNRNDKQFS